MPTKVLLQIDKNKRRLHYLIEKDAPYEKIVEQSQKLDNYITKFYKLKTRVR